MNRYKIREIYKRFYERKRKSSVPEMGSKNCGQGLEWSSSVSEMRSKNCAGFLFYFIREIYKRFYERNSQLSGRASDNFRW